MAGLLPTLRPGCDGVGHIVDQPMDTAFPVVPVGSSLCHDKDVALVGHTQGTLQRAQDNFFNVGIGVGVFIHEDPFRPGLIGAG